MQVLKTVNRCVKANVKSKSEHVRNHQQRGRVGSQPMMMSSKDCLGAVARMSRYSKNGTGMVKKACINAESLAHTQGPATLVNPHVMISLSEHWYAEQQGMQASHS